MSATDLPSLHNGSDHVRREYPILPPRTPPCVGRSEIDRMVVKQAIKMKKRLTSIIASGGDWTGN